MPAESTIAPSSHPASRWAALVRMVRSIATADPTTIEAAARQLGASRRWLAPLGWAAGTIVLLVTGIKLLILNWRLSLIQFVPAAWIWLAMWDLKRHFLHGASFRHLSVVALAILAVAVVLGSVAAYWCNTVFAFAIDGPPPPRLAPAMRKARPELPTIVTWGVTVGAALAVAVVLVPRDRGLRWFGLTLGAVLVVMMISFVAVPARIIGVKPKRLPIKQQVGGLAARGALSAVAVTPGFILDRIGLILLGSHNLRILGFALLSVGTALYAAGMSSVKAVKLSSKLVSAPT